jgi:hypothetical protein
MDRYMEMEMGMGRARKQEAGMDMVYSGRCSTLL